MELSREVYWFTIFHCGILLTIRLHGLAGVSVTISEDTAVTSSIGQGISQSCANVELVAVLVE